MKRLALLLCSLTFLSPTITNTRGGGARGGGHAGGHGAGHGEHSGNRAGNRGGNRNVNRNVNANRGGGYGHGGYGYGGYGYGAGWGAPLAVGATTGLVAGTALGAAAANNN